MPELLGRERFLYGYQTRVIAGEEDLRLHITSDAEIRDD
jgi:hypothetical protein